MMALPSLTGNGVALIGIAPPMVFIGYGTVAGTMSIIFVELVLTDERN